MTSSDSLIRRGVQNPSAIPTYVRSRLTQWYDYDVWNPIFATSMFSLDWDVCVVLDACRMDLAAAASNERDWLPAPSAIWSVASNSRTWYEQTTRRADDEDLRHTALVSGNPHTPAVSDVLWGVFDEVWRYGYDEEYGTVPPRPVTDRAITVSREQDPERLLVHYMQPHLPPVCTTDHDFGWDQSTGEWTDPWLQAADGEREVSTVRSLYESNIDPVLDDVSLLLDNVDAERVVMTADHGNYIGENGKWSHPARERGAPVRRVPLWTLSAEDTGRYEPDSYDRESETATRADQLAALGYRE